MLCSLNIGILFPGSQYADENVIVASVSYLNDFLLYTSPPFTMIAMLRWAFDVLNSTIFVSPLGLGLNFQPFGGFIYIMKPILNSSAIALSIGYIATAGQIFILYFAFFGLMKYYLPIALVLRSFTPTRRFGGTLLAIILSLTLIYPWIIVLEGYLIEEMHFFDRILGLLLPLVLVVLSTAIALFISYLASPLISAIGSVLAPFAAIGATIYVLYEIFTGNGLLGLVDKIVYGILYASNAVSVAIVASVGLVLFYAVTYGVMFSLLFPAFNVVLLTTAAKYISRTLGEEVDISNLTRLI